MNKIRLQRRSVKINEKSKNPITISASNFLYGDNVRELSCS